MKKLVLSILILITTRAAWAEKTAVERIQINGPNFLLKRISERINNTFMRAIVVDQDGREQQLLITADDAIEIKRGLWIIRPGEYEAAI